MNLDPVHLRRFSLRRAGLATTLVLVLTIGLYAAGFFAPLERAFGDIRFHLLSRPATGGIVLVLIDSRSLGALPEWPWPRRFHARVVENLHEAGAAAIAVDIDFSARSTAEDDALLERALRTVGGGVILPAFQQHRTIGVPEDGLVTTWPLGRFANQAALASVNMRPGADGLVRDHIPDQRVGEERLRSVAARLAGPDVRSAIFGIDFGIEVATLPRLSFADVYHGTFDPGAVAGRKVVIGASAFELGDVLAVPVYKALPGTVVHALAYESIVQGRMLLRLAPGPIVGGTVALTLILCPLFMRWRWRISVTVAVCLLGFVLTLAVIIQAMAPITPEILPWAAAVVLSFIMAVLFRMDDLLERVFRQGMALLHRTALLRIVVEDSFDGVLIINDRRRIELINQAGLALLGIGGQPLVGHRLNEALPAFAVPDAVWSGLQDGIGGPEPARFEIMVPHPDGTTRRLEIAARSSDLRRRDHPTTRRDRSRAIVVLVFRDVTAHRAAEEARTEALHQAQTASKAKSDFLANMSHELRTPLNAIIGFSEIIKGEMLGPVGVPAYADYAGDIHRSGAHLLSIINDILDLSRIESGAVRADNQLVDMGAVARFAVRMLADRAEAAGVSIAVDAARDLPPLRGDDRFLRQIAVNLLSNAVKFTLPGGHVEMSLVVDDEGALVLRVSDTGIGIAPADLPEIMNPFRQADSGLSRRYEGTGLGLALVKSLVELHEGSVRLESMLGEGTTAIARFPATRLQWAVDPAADRALSG